MRKEIVKKYYNNCWYLRDFDFLPMHLSEHPQLSSIQQHVIQNIDNRISIFYSLEDAVNASYNIRKLLGISNFEIVLKKLYDKDKLYEIYGIDESCDKHLSGTNSDVKVKKFGKRI